MIDLNINNKCSKIAYSFAEKTFKNRENKIGYPINTTTLNSTIINFENIHIGITSDGIGTKIELAERIGIYTTLGFDLVAMIVDALIANGIEP